MATKKRERSGSGFYHVFHRGICQFDIFEDDTDREFYLERLVKYCRELEVEVHAWCLMDNHTHLLIKADLEALSAMMRMLGSAYAKFFNWRHLRTGPLFEGRFTSVPVETDRQYVTVMRYIHRNPIHHDQAALCGSYRWSSYGEHVAAAPQTCVVKFALELFGGVGEFTRAHADSDADRERMPDIGTCGRMRDGEARGRANRALAEAGFHVDVAHVGTLPRRLRDDALSCVRRQVKCSLRQLQRLTAIAYSAIRGAVLAAEGSPVEVAADLDEAVVSPLQELVAALEGPAGGSASAVSSGSGFSAQPALGSA